MKLSLTTSDVVKAIRDYINKAMPTLADADIALDYTLTRGAKAQLTIDVLVGEDAVEFRQQQEVLAANQKPMGRKKVAEVTEEEVAEEAFVSEEEQEQEDVKPVAKPASRFKRTSTGE